MAFSADVVKAAAVESLVRFSYGLQVRSILYTSVPELCMSDHKPIKSVLEVRRLPTALHAGIIYAVACKWIFDRLPMYRVGRQVEVQVIEELKQQEAYKCARIPRRLAYVVHNIYYVHRMLTTFIIRRICRELDAMENEQRPTIKYVRAIGIDSTALSCGPR